MIDSQRLCRPLLAAALLTSACVGAVGEGQGGGPDGVRPSPVGGGASGTAGRAGAGGAGGARGAAPIAGAGFSCDPAAPLRPDRMRRLSSTQYRNVVRDLVRLAARDATTAMEVLADVNPALTRFPEDGRAAVADDPNGSYRRLSQDVQDDMVEAAYDVGAALGRSLSTSTRLKKVLGECGADPTRAPAAECLDRFLASFGERALRRPLTADDRAFLRGVHGPSPTVDPAGFADMVTVLMSMPDLFYLVESGEAAVAGRKGVHALSPYELASRLALHFWQTLPDDELWQAAKSGTLATPAGYARQVDRLFADARTKATIDEFYRDWLKVEELPPLDALAGDPAFKAFAGKDLPGRTLRESMVADLLDFVRHHTWTTAGTVDDLFTSELSFARSPDLANIYGTPLWNGGEPPRFSPAGSRPGLLTRAALLATGLANTRPIMKGVFIRRNLLCDTIPPPPEGASQTNADVAGNVTTRGVVERLTEQPGTACAACHTTLINPLGFATENFDALGRLRTEQVFFSDKGMMLGKAPVDTRVVAAVEPGDATVAAGPADLARLIVASGKAHACLARNYFRFTFGRWDDPARDGCALEALRAKVAGGGSLRDMVKQVALEPDFKQRAFE